ncbi:MAG TPA: hypothetical protein H9894_02860 [Candidatus Desulfovibrio intestinipullorum]|uniref:Cyclophilin-like domain-containing protein n=1 Tax=Candidatus Desulfovibrio intestinipullorum TaxID=2838536 RepID=A0A9D1TPJ2_9BACT|nr:hypothetical protein [Candidatus Desulfovibrio intestinipullorum]
MLLKLLRMSARLFLRAVFLVLLTSLPVQDAAAGPGDVQVRLLFAGQEARVVLKDTPAARGLCALLPLELTFEDYNATEKIAVLPKRLSIGESPTICDPEPGTLAYFIPWGNLAIFYRDFRLSRNLVPLGRVVSGLEALGSMQGDFLLRMERVQ